MLEKRCQKIYQSLPDTMYVNTHGLCCNYPPYVLFLSLGFVNKSAYVLPCTGGDKHEAWNHAMEAIRVISRDGGADVKWIKADILTEALRCKTNQLSYFLHRLEGFSRFGISLDDRFENAFLEAEMSSNDLWNNKTKRLDLQKLNLYLEENGRQAVKELPEDCYLFQTEGWLLEEDTIIKISGSTSTYGRRNLDQVDKEFVHKVLISATKFLVDQLHDNGKFTYGIHPKTDSIVPGYNMMRHASTIWSLILDYKITGDRDLVEKIQLANEYMIRNSIIYRDDRTAYFLDPVPAEFKLGGAGVAIVALTEYMNTFHTKQYDEICVSLGNGILTMLDANHGTFVHVLNRDFSVKDEFRTIYYEGESVFGLVRLYGRTKDPKWLHAAQVAIDHFITEHYETYRDHWIAYAMNEFTKYVGDEVYYSFAMRNVQSNLATIYNCETTYHTFLELLMVSFETYDRMLKEPGRQSAAGVDADFLLRTIKRRVNLMLKGYLFPEVAMYLKNPESVVGTFMVRHEQFRIRIDDVQHNIDGYYLFYHNYEKLVNYGYLEVSE